MEANQTMRCTVRTLFRSKGSFRVKLMKREMKFNLIESFPHAGISIVPRFLHFKPLLSATETLTPAAQFVFTHSHATLNPPTDTDLSD